MNKCIIMGNITKDLEIKQTPNGHSVMNFSMATNSKVKKGEVWEDKVEFHNLIVWGKTAETIEKYCNKGSKILIEGQLETRSWEDKETQAKRYKTEIVVRSFEFAGGKSEGQTNTKKIESDTEFAKQVKKQNEEISISDVPFK